MDSFSALADPTRREILELLVTKGELSATDISQKFRMSMPAISQHLKILRDTKLVSVEKRAQQRIYQINPTAVNDIEKWIDKLRRNFDERYTRLEKLMKED